MPTDEEYTQAASAVAAGNATPRQVELNNRMASAGPRWGNANVGQAQDAQATAAQRNRS